MDLITTFAIAVGLAMDAFSVSIAVGTKLNDLSFRHYFRLSFHFGLFQFLMPIIGYFAGVYAEEYIQDYDHWVAFGLLGLIGGKMIYESFSDSEHFKQKDPTRGWTLVLLSIATSIDALAVGLSIGILNHPILYPSVIIGLVCLGFSLFGLHIGKKVALIFGKRVELLGGIILIAIGIKIVLEHTVMTA